MKSSHKSVMKVANLLHVGWLVMQLEVQGGSCLRYLITCSLEIALLSCY